MRVALVGAGTVGTAVAYLLSQRHHEIVGVSSRSTDSAAQASERLGADVFPLAGLPDADIILIGAADAAIEEVAGHVAERVSPDTFVCHFAGSFGPSVLGSVMSSGARACATHPVQACPTFDAAVARLPGSTWGVTCSDVESEKVISKLIESDLGGTALVVAEDVRPLWHAAAVMTSNGIAALLTLAERLLASIGIEDPEKVLGPLAAGTVTNAIEGGGGGRTLTGPVVRGDEATIVRHLERLGVHDEHQRQDYKMIQSVVFIAAMRSGRLSKDELQEVLNALTRPR